MSVYTGDKVEKTKRKSKKHKEANPKEFIPDQFNNVTDAKRAGKDAIEMQEVTEEIKEPLKKEKRKKRKEVEEEEGADSTLETRQKKRGKEDIQKKNATAEEVNERLKEKDKEGTRKDGKISKEEEENGQKKKKAKGGIQGEVTVDEAGKKQEKKKKKRGSESVQDEGAAEEVHDPASSKKSKKKRKKDDSETVNEQSGDQASSERKKKKHKTSKHGFSDPDVDESLVDQAKKALSYAYVHAEDPSSWKFNKAKQNWLIRNVWSDEAVPDSYLGLALRYLSKVQGGAREALTKTCQEIVSATPGDAPSAESVKDEAASVLPTVSVSNPTKIQRAKDLLAALSKDD